MLGMLVGGWHSCWSTEFPSSLLTPSPAGVPTLWLFGHPLRCCSQIFLLPLPRTGPTASRTTALGEASLLHKSIHALTCSHFYRGSPLPMEQAHTCSFSPKPCWACPGQQ